MGCQNLTLWLTTQLFMLADYDYHDAVLVLFSSYSLNTSKTRGLWETDNMKRRTSHQAYILKVHKICNICNTYVRSVSVTCKSCNASSVLVCSMPIAGIMLVVDHLNVSKSSKEQRTDTSFSQKRLASYLDKAIYFYIYNISTLVTSPIYS